MFILAIIILGITLGLIGFVRVWSIKNYIEITNQFRMDYPPSNSKFTPWKYSDEPHHEYTE